MEMQQLHEADPQRHDWPRAVQGQVPRGQEHARGHGDREEGTRFGEVPWRDPRHLLRQVRLICGEEGIWFGHTMPREADTSRETGACEDQAG